MLDKVDYDSVAPNYHRRYTINPLPGIAQALHQMTPGLDARHVLEVGCGTGHWLSELKPLVGEVTGLDLSLGMLHEAQRREAAFQLTCGEAGALPFRSARFDLVFCVNAFHHFPQPRAFIAEAWRLLRRGGALTVIGMDPHAGRDHWFLYDYFEGTREIDLRRFPSSGVLLDWAVAAGFARAEWRVVEIITDSKTGRDVLSDHFIQKHGTSQLTLLSDEAYAAGLARLRADVENAEATNTQLTFAAQINLIMFTAFK